MIKFTRNLVPLAFSLVGILPACSYHKPNSSDYGVLSQNRNQATVEEAMRVLGTNQSSFIVHLPHGYKSLRTEESKLMRLSGVKQGSVKVSLGNDGNFDFSGNYIPLEDKDYSSALAIMKEVDSNGDYIISPSEVKALEQIIYLKYSK